MKTIAIWAASAVLAAVGGSTAGVAYAAGQSGDGAQPRVRLGNAQPASFVRSADGIVPVAAGDDHRRRHAEPGDDRGREDRRGDDRGRHHRAGTHHRRAEPGDDHGRHRRHRHHAGPGDDHGRHGGHGADD